MEDLAPVWQGGDARNSVFGRRLSQRVDARFLMCSCPFKTAAGNGNSTQAHAHYKINTNHFDSAGSG